jgi:hypothetical protein
MERDGENPQCFRSHTSQVTALERTADCKATPFTDVQPGCDWSHTIKSNAGEPQCFETSKGANELSYSIKYIFDDDESGPLYL